MEIPTTIRSPVDIDQVLDETQCRLVIAKLGLTDFVEAQMAKARSIGQTAIYTICKGHPDVWILIARFENQPRPEDNGTTILCAPKSLYSWDRFDQLLKKHLLDYNAVGGESAPFSTIKT